MPKAVSKLLNVLPRIMEYRFVMESDALMSVNDGDYREVCWEVHMQTPILTSFLVTAEVSIASYISVG